MAELNKQLSACKIDLAKANDELEKTTLAKDETIKTLRDELEKLRHANGKGTSLLAEAEERWRKALEEEVSLVCLFFSIFD